MRLGVPFEWLRRKLAPRTASRHDHAIVRQDPGILNASEDSCRPPMRILSPTDHGSREIPDDIYWAVREAMLEGLPDSGDGLQFPELVAATAAHINQELFPNRAALRWHAKVIQVDLETRWLIERVPGSQPARYRRARRAARIPLRKHRPDDGVG